MVTLFYIGVYGNIIFYIVIYYFSYVLLAEIMLLIVHAMIYM